MSKRLGNAVDPFSTLAQYGPDATRWYMITNAEPWDNLKFNLDGVGEVQRKLFGTLSNTYNFFALYANLDKFVMGAAGAGHSVLVAERPELDRWILSKLQSLILEVEGLFRTSSTISCRTGTCGCRAGASGQARRTKARR
jgi:isoleucyl-tRNA synthetase